MKEPGSRYSREQDNANGGECGRRGGGVGVRAYGHMDTEEARRLGRSNGVQHNAKTEVRRANHP